jgi:hypothetical protein
MAGLIALAFDKEDINPALLRAELTAALGPKFAGISRCGAALRVHILDTTGDADRARIAGIVRAHDASRLSADQQAEVTRAALVESLRKPWADWTAVDKDNFLRCMAGERGLI